MLRQSCHDIHVKVRGQLPGVDFLLLPMKVLRNSITNSITALAVSTFTKWTASEALFLWKPWGHRVGQCQRVGLVSFLFSMSLRRTWVYERGLELACPLADRMKTADAGTIEWSLPSSKILSSPRNVRISPEQSIPVLPHHGVFSASLSLSACAVWHGKDEAWVPAPAHPPEPHRFHTGLPIAKHTSLNSENTDAWLCFSSSSSS